MCYTLLKIIFIFSFPQLFIVFHFKCHIHEIPLSIIFQLFYLANDKYIFFAVVVVCVPLPFFFVHFSLIRFFYSVEMRVYISFQFSIQCMSVCMCCFRHLMRCKNRDIESKRKKEKIVEIERLRHINWYMTFIM